MAVRLLEDLANLQKGLDIASASDDHDDDVHLGLRGGEVQRGFLSLLFALDVLLACPSRLEAELLPNAPAQSSGNVAALCGLFHGDLQPAVSARNFALGTEEFIVDQEASPLLAVGFRDSRSRSPCIGLLARLAVG